MNKILEQINSPEDLRRLKMVEKKIPAIECFDKVIGRETRYIKTRM